MKTLQEYKQLIQNSTSYEELSDIFNEICLAEKSGQMQKLDWWILYDDASPKLQKLFKQTEAGRQMLSVLNKKPIQVLSSVVHNAITTFSIPRPNENDFAALESVCGYCGEDLIFQGGVMRCSICGTCHLPAQVNKAESQHDDFGFQPFTIANPVF